MPAEIPDGYVHGYSGERVRVTGSFVTDRESGWNEVHPVARIDKLR